MGISVIIPVYNGEKFISINLLKLHKFLEQNYFDYEIIVVNDGSIDKTYDVIFSLKIPNLTIISYKKNKGRGFAIKEGLSKSKYNLVFYTDCDLPYSFSTLKILIDQVQTGNFGLVICSRILPSSRLVLNYHSAHKFFIRWLGGRVINLFIRLILGIPFRDTQAGTKAFNKEKISNLVQRCFINRWAFDCEIIYLCYKNNISIKEVPTIQEFDVEESTVKFLDGLEYMKDVLRIFVKHKIGI